MVVRLAAASSFGFAGSGAAFAASVVAIARGPSSMGLSRSALNIARAASSRATIGRATTAPHASASARLRDTASSRARSQIAPRRRAFSTAARATTLPGRRAVSTASSDDGTGLPGTEHGGRRLAIVFTCTVCDTRSAKKFSEQAYREGVVVVRCPGCGNDHLIADNLGFFEDDWTLEDVLRARGDSVETLDDDNLAEGVDAELLKRLVEGRRDK